MIPFSRETPPSRFGDKAVVASGWQGAFALHDVIVIAYFVIIRVLVWLASPGWTRATLATQIDVCIVAMVAACLLGRLWRNSDGRLRSQVYRVVLMWVVIHSYLMLRDLLPLVRPDSVDQALLSIDELFFGIAPALWFERYNHLWVVEWFSFFYFSYFLVCGTFVFHALWLEKPGRHTATLAIGSLLVLFCGHLGYFLVPGYGPIEYLNHAFHAPLQGGFFWSCVRRTVDAGGAMKDIFPSLHTALPAWFALYAANRARHDRKWRSAAGVAVFFALNIVASTLVLRWHYAVDVVAGLALALAASWAAPRLAAREAAWRARRGFEEAWPICRRARDR